MKGMLAGRQPLHRRLEQDAGRRLRELNSSDVLAVGALECGLCGLRRRWHRREN